MSSSSFVYRPYELNVRLLGNDTGHSQNHCVGMNCVIWLVVVLFLVCLLSSGWYRWVSGQISSFTLSILFFYIFEVSIKVKTRGHILTIPIRFHPQAYAYHKLHVRSLPRISSALSFWLVSLMSDHIIESSDKYILVLFVPSNPSTALLHALLSAFNNQWGYPGSQTTHISNKKDKNM